MANYSIWGEYLNAKHDSFENEFKEIEKIIGILPPSAYEYKEWWSNSPSHSLMKVSLKNGWRQTNLDLFLKKVGFYQSENKQQVVTKKTHHVTIFEATNQTAKSRLPMIKITEKLQVPSLCLVFTASENIIKNRLTARSSGVDEASYSDADWDIYSKLKPSQEPPDQNHWYVDSTKDISISLNKLVKIIRSHPQNPNIY